MFLRKLFTKKKEQPTNLDDIKQVEADKETEREEEKKEGEDNTPDLNYGDVCAKNELEKLKNKFNEINKALSSSTMMQITNSDDVNLVTTSLQERMRDLYNNFGNNKTLQYMTYIISQETIVPDQIYDYYIEMMVKNECLLKRIIEIPVNTTFKEFNIINATFGKKKLPLSKMEECIHCIYPILCSAITRSELYGGVYLALQDNTIKLYQMSQLINYNNISKEVNTAGYSKLYTLNKILHRRNFTKEDLQWLKSNQLEYMDFVDGTRVPYNNLFVFVSTNKPMGQFMETMTHGFNLSILEGCLHHIVGILRNLASITEQISVQNRTVLKVDNYFALTKQASLRQMYRANDALSQVTATRTTGGIITDKENEVELLTSQVQISEIIEYAVLKMSALLFNIPLQWLTGETSARYVNTQLAADQQEQIKTGGNVLLLTYKRILNEVIKAYLSKQNLTASDNVSNNEVMLEEDDYEITFNI